MAPGALLTEQLAGRNDDALGPQTLEYLAHVDGGRSLKPETRAAVGAVYLPLIVFAQQRVELGHALVQQCPQRFQMWVDTLGREQFGDRLLTDRRQAEPALEKLSLQLRALPATQYVPIRRFRADDFVEGRKHQQLLRVGEVAIARRSRLEIQLAVGVVFEQPDIPLCQPAANLLFILRGHHATLGDIHRRRQHRQSNRRPLQYSFQ